MTLRHFSEASYTLASQSLFPLAAVDCFDWTDVCARVNITRYPTIRIYWSGKEPADYRGMLSPQAIVETVNMYVPVLVARISHAVLTSVHHLFRLMYIV